MERLSNFRKIIISLLVFFVLSISASQCFAKSTENSSNEADAQNRQYMALMDYLFEYIRQRYVDEVDAEVLYHGALKGMLEALEDPYSTYLDKSAFRNISDTTEGKFGGVGLSISKPFESTADKPAYVEVASPIEDTPGFRAGILAGDLIISVDGVDTSTITMEEVLNKLRGPVDEDVDLIIRRGKNMEFPVTLTRAFIEVPTVKHGMINSIGYIRIIEFTPLTAEKVQAALDEFVSKKATSLIIDLRNNPGGLISSVADVADKFIDNGPIVTTKSRNAADNSSFVASAKKTTFTGGLPIVVLLNKGSASASEILAGALKDNHLAYLVGQRTYGKGSVQQVFHLSQTDGFKYTVARYYTPSDVCIDKIGIPPDREILFPALSEEGEKQTAELFKSNVIEKYVEAHSGMTEKDISAYAKKLRTTYNAIDEASLRKLIRNQVNRKNGAMLYDLDYDIQLNEAINILTKENFKALMKKAKTLKELQDAAVLGEKKK